MGKNVIELSFNAANQLFNFDADATVKVGSNNNNILSIAGPYSTTNALLTSYLLANGNTVDRKRAHLTSDTREVEGETYPIWTYTLEPAIVNAVGARQAIELFVTVIEDTIVLDANAITDKGTFGNLEADVLDVPATADEGDYYTCQEDNFNSANAGLTFQRLDVALFTGGEWTNSTIFITNSATDQVELTVSGGFIDQTQTQEVTQTDLILDAVANNEDDIVELQDDKLDKDFQKLDVAVSPNPPTSYFVLDEGKDGGGNPINTKISLEDAAQLTQFDRGTVIDKTMLPDPSGLLENSFIIVTNPLSPETLTNEKWIISSGDWVPTGTQGEASLGDIDNLQSQIGDLDDLDPEFVSPDDDDLVKALNSIIAQKGSVSGITPLNSNAEIDTIYFEDIVLLRAGTIGATGDIQALPTVDVKRGTFYTFIDDSPFTDPTTGFTFRSKGEIVYNNAIATETVEWLQISGATVFTVNNVQPDGNGNVQIEISNITNLQTELDAKFLKTDLVQNLDTPLDTTALSTTGLKVELDAKANASDNNSVAGILAPPSAVINDGDNTAVDVGAGRFKFIKFVGNDRITVVVDTVPETISMQNISTQDTSVLYYMLDENDDAILKSDNGTVDPEQSQTKAYFSLAFHQGGIITRVQHEGLHASAFGHSYYNIIYPSHNNANLEGNNYTGVVAERQFDVTAGKIYGFGYNGRVDPTAPDITTTTAETPDEYLFVWRDGAGGISVRTETDLTTDYDPNGDGDLVEATGTANTSLVYYIFRSGKTNPDIPSQSSFETFIIAPQSTFATQEAAILAFETGNIPLDNIPQSLIDSVTWRYAVAIRNSGGDFSIPTDAEFIEVTDDVAGLSGGTTSSLNASQIVNDSAEVTNLARGANIKDVTDSLDAELNFFNKTSSATYNGTGSYTLDDIFDVQPEYYLDVKFPISSDTDLATLTITGFIVDAPIVDIYNVQLTVSRLSSNLTSDNPRARLVYDGTSFVFTAQTPIPSPTQQYTDILNSTFGAGFEPIKGSPEFVEALGQTYNNQLDNRNDFSAWTFDDVTVDTSGDVAYLSFEPDLISPTSALIPTDMKINTTYTILGNIIKNTITTESYFVELADILASPTAFVSDGDLGIVKATITTGGTITDNEFRMRSNSNDVDGNVLIRYIILEGDFLSLTDSQAISIIDNVDFGVQSIDNLTLKSTGVNLLDSLELELGGISNDQGLDIVDVRDVRTSFISTFELEDYFIKINDLSQNALIRIHEVFFYGSNQNFLGLIGNIIDTEEQFTTIANTSFVRIQFRNSDSSDAVLSDYVNGDIQLEQGTLTTDYTPHDTATLTVKGDYRSVSDGTTKVSDKIRVVNDSFVKDEYVGYDFNDVVQNATWIESGTTGVTHHRYFIDGLNSLLTNLKVPISDAAKAKLILNIDNVSYTVLSEDEIDSPTEIDDNLFSCALSVGGNLYIVSNQATSAALEAFLQGVDVLFQYENDEPLLAQPVDSDGTLNCERVTTNEQLNNFATSFSLIYPLNPNKAIEIGVKNNQITQNQVDLNELDIETNKADIATNADAIGLNTTHRETITGNPHDLDTADVTENTNLYYTESRVNANTNVAANTVHRGSDGKNHSDVVTNTSDIATKRDKATVLFTGTIAVSSSDSKPASNITLTGGNLDQFDAIKVQWGSSGATTSAKKVQDFTFLVNGDTIGLSIESNQKADASPGPEQLSSISFVLERDTSTTMTAYFATNNLITDSGLFVGALGTIEIYNIWGVNY